MKRRAISVVLVTIFVGLGWAVPADAQVVINARSPRENASPGAVALRAPGNMVRAGVARAQEFARTAAAGVEITQVERPSVWAQALAESIATVFNQLNTGIVLFQNLLPARAGRPPVLPTTITPVVGGTGTGGIDLGGADLGGVDLGDLDVDSILDQLGLGGFGGR